MLLDAEAKPLRSSTGISRSSCESGRNGPRLPVIDLFAGAGGLSIGATHAGCEVRACVELDAIACRTLKANESYHGAVIQADVAAITGLELRDAARLSPGDPLIVVGGAPCQPFSKAAYWTEDGEESR